MRPRCVSVTCLLFWISFCCGRVLVTDDTADALISGANPGRCSLPPKTGPCRAAFPRWYFNSTLNECIEFVYGGCDGNENNFETKQNCNETCKASAVPQQALEDDPVEKTIRTYMKLVKDGVQPEKPVPFFSEHEMFRRSTQRQNPPVRSSAGQDLMRNSSEKHNVSNSMKARASKSGLNKSVSPSLGGSDKTTTINRSELQFMSRPKPDLQPSSEPKHSSSHVAVDEESESIERGSKPNAQPSSEPKHSSSHVDDHEESESVERGSNPDLQPSSEPKHSSSHVGDHEESESVERGSKPDLQPSSEPKHSSIHDDDEESASVERGSKPDLQPSSEPKHSSSHDDDEESASVERGSKPDLQPSSEPKHSSSHVGDHEESESVERGSNPDLQPSSEPKHSSSHVGDHEESESVERGSKPDLQPSSEPKHSSSHVGDHEESESVERGSKPDAQPSSEPKHTSSHVDEKSESVERGSKPDSQPSAEPKHPSSHVDEESESVKRGSKADSQPSSEPKHSSSHVDHDEESESVERGSKPDSQPSSEPKHSSSEGGEQEGESGRRKPDSQSKKHSSQEQQEFSGSDDKTARDESLEDDYDSSNTQTYWKDSSIYRGSDPLEHTSSHFAAFFLTSIVMVFAAYVIYHNRQKIIAIIIEGRNDSSSRSRGYRKLETNVEEAMPSMQKSTNSTYVY